MRTEPAEGQTGNAAFVRIRRYFLNIDRGMGRLLGSLRTNSAALGIVQWDTPFISTRFRSCEIYILSSIGVKCVIARLKRLLGYQDRLVSLPDSGDVAMFCFPGRVRIFDLNGHRITNLCNSGNRDFRQKLATVIDHQETLGKLGVAPRICRKEDGDSYVEELCEGMPLKLWRWWDRHVFQEVTTAARTIQASRPAISTTIKDMVDEMNDLVGRLDSLYPGSIEDAVDELLINEIRNVCNNVDTGERVEGLLSHGDLARRNILVRRDNSLVFIDWQTLDYRVRDYDVYNYYFSVVEDHSADWVPEYTVFEWLGDALGFQDQDAVLSGLNKFKLEYYITRFKYFLLSPDSDSSRMARVLVQMYDYTRCFQRYGEYCGVVRTTA